MQISTLCKYIQSIKAIINKIDGIIISIRNLVYIKKNYYMINIRNIVSKILKYLFSEN